MFDFKLAGGLVGAGRWSFVVGRWSGRRWSLVVRRRLSVVGRRLWISWAGVEPRLAAAETGQAPSLPAAGEHLAVWGRYERASRQRADPFECPRNSAPVRPQEWAAVDRCDPRGRTRRVAATEIPICRRSFPRPRRGCRDSWVQSPESPIARARSARER